MRNSALVASEVGATSVALLIENEVLCRGLEAVLRALPGVGTVRRCASREDVANPLGDDRFDVLIAAARDLEWLAVTRQLLAERGTKILMLVDALADPFDYTSVPVDGYLSQQDLSAETLRDTLHRSARGELPMPSIMARALLANADVPAQRQRARTVNLTSRESEALALLVKGMSNKQIARQLSISSHGAKRLVASIMLKLDSPNRTTAVVNAIKAGIIDYQ